MNKSQCMSAQVAMLLIAALYSIKTAASLPKVVPTHWGIDGKPDAYGSPAFALWFGPAMIVFFMLLTPVLMKISPKQFEIDRFERTFGLIMTLMAAMFLAIHIVILASTAGSKIDMMKVMMMIFGVSFALFGNQMGKVRRNYFMGIRTPWTLSSDRVWDATHRQAGIVWFYGGMFVALLAAIGLPFAVTFTLFMAITLWPVLLSYQLYRKMES